MNLCYVLTLQHKLFFTEPKKNGKKIKYNKEDLKHTQSYGMADQMTIKKKHETA